MSSHNCQVGKLKKGTWWVLSLLHSLFLFLDVVDFKDFLNADLTKIPWALNNQLLYPACMQMINIW